MDIIGITFAGFGCLIVLMAFVRIYFPADGNKDTSSITITGTGRGVDVVDRITGGKSQ
jgi:hypothetical protein